MADGSTIAEQIADINASKAAIAGAIAEKGVTVPAGTKLGGLAALVSEIQQTGGGGSYPIALDAFTDTGYLWVGGYSSEDFLSRLGSLANVIGEPYVALMKGPQAGASGKMCGIFLTKGGEGTVDENTYAIRFAIGGKLLTIPFQQFCDVINQQIGANCVTEY